MASYQILDHTGEIGILGRGANAAQAFEQAATGMFSFMVDLETVEGRQEWRVEVEGPDLEGLLVEWLNELIYLFELEGMVSRDFRIHEMGSTFLKATCYGEVLDVERHRFSIAPKAATYHMLEVTPETARSECWAKVILDI